SALHPQANTPLTTPQTLPPRSTSKSRHDLGDHHGREIAEHGDDLASAVESEVDQERVSVSVPEGPVPANWAALARQSARRRLRILSTAARAASSASSRVWR